MVKVNSELVERRRRRRRSVNARVRGETWCGVGLELCDWRRAMRVTWRAVKLKFSFLSFFF